MKYKSFSFKIYFAAFFSFKIYFAAGLIGVQNLFCGRIDWSAKFILRFDFLNITVRHEIGKRYKSVQPKVRKAKSGHNLSNRRSISF